MIDNLVISEKWGTSQLIANTNDFKILNIVINPGEIFYISNNKHHTSHISIVNGNAKIKIGNDIIIKNSKSNFNIPSGIECQIVNKSYECHILEIILVEIK